MNPLDIRELLSLLIQDTDSVVEFNQSFTVQPVQLGELLVDSTDSTADFLYVVCEGKVRIVGQNLLHQREVSVGFLEAGDTVGAEALFCDRPLVYQAIVAASGLVARIPIVALKPWLTTLPNFREQLKQSVYQRERLLFFKTETPLYPLTQKPLQTLLSRLSRVRVPAGKRLDQIEECRSGTFWLADGTVCRQDGPTLPVAEVGESWGHPQAMPEDWMAVNDVVLYRLPVEDWEAAVAIAPMLKSRVDDDLTDPRSDSWTQNIVPVVPRSRMPIIAVPHPATTEQRGFPEPQKAQRSFGGNSKRSGRKILQNYPFIQQQSSADCGITCLAMLGQFWGTKFNINYLRELAGVERSGTTLKNLATAAETVGFQARPVRASLGRLRDHPHPWIAHWNGVHYVVVYRVKGQHALIADPEEGKKKISVQEFEQHWTGYALLLDPSENLGGEGSGDRLSLNRFWGLLRPYRSLMAQILVASFLIQLFGLVTPLFTQIILDRVVTQKSTMALNVFAIGLFMFGIWQLGLVAVRQYLLDYFSNRLDLTFISGFVSHTLLLPLKFFQTRQVGDIITRVQENQKVQLFLTRQMIVVWLDALMAIVYLGLMTYYNVQLTILVVVMLLMIVGLVVLSTSMLRQASREIFNRDAAETSALVEVMTGISTIKVTAAERDLRWRWEDKFTESLNARFRGQKLANNLGTISGFINTMGSTALLWFGASLVIQDQLTIGQFVGFNMLFGNVTAPVMSLARLWDEFQEVIVSVERLNDVFSAQPEEDPQHPGLVLPRLRGAVRYEAVTFRYGQGQERNTLQTVDFSVRAGQTIAIVGPSGSGKSTLLNLLQALYQPTSGRVLVDGYDIRHASPRSLRAQLGVVPQDCFLFSGTIFENITLFRDEYTLEDAVQVAKLAEAHGFIQELPLGYNTPVGERGASLSGGQRQRIAIARALLGDPAILILDEATSSLDSESERRFQANLARIRRGRTTFIIAHRLATVRDADGIFVFNQGVLSERGTHTELMAQQGLYYYLAQQQIGI